MNTTDTAVTENVASPSNDELQSDLSDESLIVNLATEVCMKR